jgi:hypothetical protein
MGGRRHRGRAEEVIAMAERRLWIDVPYED